MGRQRGAAAAVLAACLLAGCDRGAGESEADVADNQPDVAQQQPATGQTTASTRDAEWIELAGRDWEDLTFEQAVELDRPNWDGLA